MKKLTAGILTVMLGIVSANSADAAVASKKYVDQMAKSEAAAAKTAAEATAASELLSAKTELEGKIDAKVAQADYDAKIETLEAADATFAKQAYVGALPEGTEATTIVGYIDKKTEGIASEDAMTQLSTQVSTLSDTVGTNTDAIATLNGAENETGSVANKIAGAITALDLAGTYASKTTVETAYQNAINTAEQNAKDYADTLADDYDTAGSAASALADAKAYTDELANGAVKVNTENIATLQQTANSLGTTYETKGDASAKLTEAKGYTDNKIQALDSSIAAEANKVVTGVTVVDGIITDTQKMALSAIATINPACSNPANYCVLTSNGTDFVWEVIERATDGTETLTTGGDSGRTAATTVAQ